MMPEPLAQTLERTGFRASLAEEYLAGHAPATQRRDQHVTPAQPTYYGLPPIKKPTWLWYVPAYFFVGGVASGAYIVATLADMVGREADRPLVRAGRAVALASMLLSPVLLILDLGRPERWLTMLRVFKPRSMMNLGSFALVLLGVCSGLAATAQALQDLAPHGPAARLAAPPLRLVSWLGLLPALFVGSYTGLLLSATNVPLWAGNRLLMGPLFFASALSTGLAATRLAAPLFGPASRASEERWMRAERLALGTELALTAASGLLLRGLARPLLSGRLARVYQFGSIGLGALVPLALHRLGARTGPAGPASAALVLVGGALMRFAITEAGLRSAGDPHAYFEYTALRLRRSG